MVQLYRFALYGRAGSGKTCILAALSLPHTVHPDGLTCDWVPDPPDTAQLDEERKSAYRRGQVALTEARLALSRGEKPAPTPLDEGLLCYRFVFSAARPEPRQFHVELVDYSGELIDPHLTTSELAGKLRRHLQDMDGLLVLGEAPRPGEEQARLYGEFERLRQALAALGQDKADVAERQTPVVLLLNKWDRRHPADGRPHDRDREMDEFLATEPEPAHRGLVHSLEAAVPAGSFRRFAVSAFGASRHETRRDAEGTEREVELPPKTRPLPSFGLEDGFVWLARKRDELELAGLEERATELSWGSRWPWLYLNALWPFSAWRLDRAARRVGRR